MRAEIKSPRGDARVRTDGFTREEHMVDGVRTVLYTAGQGEPLVYFHGAGTFHGFDFARAWTDRFRVILPYHPGFGESDDDLRVGALADYVTHYRRLVDQLGLDKFNLVGCSMGGRLAAEFAAVHADRLSKLVLACPAGLEVPAHPMTALGEIPPDQLIGYLIHDVGAIAAFLPDGPDPQFAAMRAREGAAVGRVLREGSLVNPELASLARRISVPTLLLWGALDRVIPVEQAAAWGVLLQHARIRTVARAGHLVLDESAEARAAVKDFLLAAA